MKDLKDDYLILLYSRKPAIAPLTRKPTHKQCKNHCLECGKPLPRRTRNKTGYCLICTGKRVGALKK